MAYGHNKFSEMWNTYTPPVWGDDLPPDSGNPFFEGDFATTQYGNEQRFSYGLSGGELWSDFRYWEPVTGGWFRRMLRKLLGLEHVGGTVNITAHTPAPRPSPRVYGEYEEGIELAMDANEILGVCAREGFLTDAALLVMCDEFLSRAAHFETMKMTREVQAERDRIALRIAIADAAKAVEKVAEAKAKIPPKKKARK